MNKLKDKQVKKLNELGCDDLARKVNEIVGWINFKKFDEELDDVCDCDETFTKEEVINLMTDAFYDGWYREVLPEEFEPETYL